MQLVRELYKERGVKDCYQVRKQTQYINVKDAQTSRLYSFYKCMETKRASNKTVKKAVTVRTGSSQVQKEWVSLESTKKLLQ